jgi:CBS domain-containing protein
MRYSTSIGAPAAAAIRRENLALVDRETSVVEASRIMRSSGFDDLFVTESVHGELATLGIVSARDIVTRIVAAELDPAVLTAGDIAWPGGSAGNERLYSAPPALHVIADSKGDLLALVDDDGRVAGVVAIGELMRAVSGERPAS